jgi:hypothetical protein
MRILILSGSVALAASGAFAQAADCSARIDHVPDPSVAYQPSPDVAPADLPRAADPYAPDRVAIDLRADRSNAAAKGRAAVRPEIYAGTVEVKPESGELSLNGRPLAPPAPCPKPQ